MNKFVDDWSRMSKPSLKQTIRNKISPSPLKDQITKTTYRITIVQRRLEESRTKMEQKYKSLFKKCINAQESKDSTTSVMYANECAQVKKMFQTIVASEIALEQVVLRLQTVKDFGDIFVEIAPAASVVHSIKRHLEGIMPDVSYNLGTIGQTLDSLVMEVGEVTGQTWNILASGEESERILAEATAVAEQKIKDKLPKLPSTTIESGFNPLF